MIRRYGDTPLKGQHYRLRPGAYAILPLHERLLLTYQGDPHFEIQLPGGGIDPGESPVQALHREVFEETGWRIASPRKLGTFRRFVYMPEYDKYAEKLCHIYLARPVRAIGPPAERNHIPVWMNAQDALPEIGRGDAAFVSRLFD